MKSSTRLRSNAKKLSLGGLEQLQARLTNFAPPVGEATYDELLKLVETRNKLKRLAFQDRVGSLVSSFSKTFFRFLLYDVQFWTSQAGYCLLRYYAHSTGCSAFPTFTPVSAVGSLSSFILVFFVSQAWSRFQQMYALAMALEGRIFDLTLLIQNLLPQAARWRVWRHINAAHCLTYIGASAHYNDANLLMPLNSRYNFLTDEELARIRSIGLSGGGATREVLSWVVTTIEENMPLEQGHYRKQALIDQVLGFRRAQGSIMDYQDLPFPFVYTTFVNVVCLLYPSLFALSTALSFDNVPGRPISWSNEVIGYLATLLNVLFFLGMHSIAKVFQDPFEHSYEDLSVLHYCRFEAEASAKILLRSAVTHLDEDVEQTMQEERDWGKLLGKQWAPQSCSDAPDTVHLSP